MIAGDVRRFVKRDQPLARKVLGRRPPLRLESILRGALRLPDRAERSAMIYHQTLPAPAELDTPEPTFDDPLLAAVVSERLRRVRVEAAWHFKGNVRIASAHPEVFVGGRLAPAGSWFMEEPDGSIARHHARQLLRRATIRVDRAVLVREFWDSNYWHMLSGVLPRFAMADALGIDPAIPAIVSSAFMEVHAERLKGAPALTGRPLIVQRPGVTVCSDELFVLQPTAFGSRWTPEALEAIPAAPQVEHAPRWIYCRRAPASGIGRTADNSRELDELFVGAGFAAVDPANMSLAEQKTLFANAEAVAGINGAAFANCLFRAGRPLAIGALISSNWMSTAFPTLSKILGFRYAGWIVRPSGEAAAAAMTVPLDTARRLIERLAKDVSRR